MLKVCNTYIWTLFQGFKNEFKKTLFILHFTYNEGKAFSCKIVYVWRPVSSKKRYEGFKNKFHIFHKISPKELEQVCKASKSPLQYISVLVREQTYQLLQYIGIK